MNYKKTLVCIVNLLLCGISHAQTRTPLPEDQITLPDYFGIFAIDAGQPIELKIPMDDFNSDPALEISPMAEFVFNGVGQKRQLIRILSQDEFNKRQRRRSKIASETFTWDNWMSLQNMQMADFANALNGLFANEEEVPLLNKLVAGKPAMIRQIPADALAIGDYRIGDGIRWYKVRVSSSPARDINDSPDESNRTYEPVNYKKLASPSFMKEFTNKRVQFDAMFLDEWTLVDFYKTCKISTSDKVFIAHRPVGYVSSDMGLASSDAMAPPFPMSLPKSKSDVIYEMNRGDIFTVRGLTKKYDGVVGMNSGLEILIEDIEVK